MSRKPWLTYGFGDGLDAVHVKKLPQPKKISWAIWVLLFFGVVGGRRFYLGDKTGGIRLAVLMIFLQILQILCAAYAEVFKSRFAYACVIAIIGLGLFILLKEFVSLNERVKCYNNSLKRNN